jgi:hypothetical protein
MQLNWAEFKTVVNARALSIQWVVAGANYWLKGIDGYFEVETLIPVDRSLSSDTIDFEDNYKIFGNKSPAAQVTTQLELNDKVLKLASSVSNFIANEAILEIRVPGIFTGVDHSNCDGRYIAGGYGWTNFYEFGDRITKVEVIDKDNLFGYGVNFIVKCYHDENADEPNMGWRHRWIWFCSFGAIFKDYFFKKCNK